MNYPLQAKPRKNQSLSRVWKILLALIVLVFLLSSFFPNFLGKVSFSIAKPVWKLRDLLTYNLLQNDYLRTKSALIKEKNNLESENLDLISKLAELETLRADNLVFRTILDRVTQTRGEAYPVIAHPTQTPYDVIIVDVDEKQSISTGDDAVLGNLALGKVSEVGEGFAKINLYSSPNTTTMATLVSSGISLELQGKGGGNFSVRVPRDTVVNMGDLVVLPSDPALALARVSDIEESEKDSFKLVRLLSLANIFSLRWVEVIR